MLILKILASKYYKKDQPICSNFLPSRALSDRFKKKGHNLFPLITKLRLIRDSCIYPSLLHL